MPESHTHWNAQSNTMFTVQTHAWVVLLLLLIVSALYVYFSLFWLYGLTLLMRSNAILYEKAKRKNKLLGLLHAHTHIFRINVCAHHLRVLCALLICCCFFLSSLQWKDVYWKLDEILYAALVSLCLCTIICFVLNFIATHNFYVESVLCALFVERRRRAKKREKKQHFALCWNDSS